ASYTIHGRLRFFRQTIRPVSMPVVHVDAAGGQTIDREAPLASLSGSVAGGDLFLLSDARPERVLDVYDAATGTYRSSFHLPERDARCVVVTEDRLFSASRRGVTIWRRHSSYFK